jgi:regulator of replication initiation timing
VSPLEKALEENAQKLLSLTRSVLSENAALHRENRKLTDQLDDACDAVAELRARVAELESMSR